MKTQVYAVKHNDENVINQSRFGGMFTAVSDYILINHGIVYGCVLNDHFNAVHMRAACEANRDRMRGSKYIQSNLGDTFKNV